MKNDENKTSITDIITTIIFMAWFLCSLFSIPFIARIGYYGLAIAIFGQYFFVISTFGIKDMIEKKKMQLPILSIPIAGFAFFVIGLFYQFGDQNMINWIEGNIPFLLLLIFPLVGILFIIQAITEKITFNRICTLEIQAECIDVLSEYDPGAADDKGHMIYKPIFKIYYNGQEMTIENGGYSTICLFTIGQHYPIKINPNNPNEFVSKLENIDEFFLATVGLSFTLVFIFIIVFLL